MATKKKKNLIMYDNEGEENNSITTDNKSKEKTSISYANEGEEKTSNTSHKEYKKKEEVIQVRTGILPYKSVMKNMPIDVKMSAHSIRFKKRIYLGQNRTMHK